MPTNQNLLWCDFFPAADSSGVTGVAIAGGVITLTLERGGTTSATLPPNAVSGSYNITTKAIDVVMSDASVIPIDVSTLINDARDISSLPVGATVDPSVDQVAFYDVSAGTMLQTSISDLTCGVTDPVPFGSIL